MGTGLSACVLIDSFWTSPPGHQIEAALSLSTPGPAYLTMTGVPLTSLSLTHVQFHPNDLLGEALAYITLAPLAILVFYASIIVSRREVAAILFLVGQLSSEGLNAILKEYLQVSRPNGKQKFT